MRHGGSIPETQGSVSIQGLWESLTEAIICVRFGYYDTETWKTEGMDNILYQWEIWKK